MKKIFLMSLCFTLWSCFSDVKREKEWLLFYGHWILEFSQDVTRHFPYDFSNYTSKRLHVFPETATRYHLKAGLILDTRVNDDFFRDIGKSLLHKEILNFSILNDSIFFLGDTLSDYSSNYYKYPLPDFSDVYDEFGLSSKRLSGKEEVFLIEYKSGEFLEPGHLVKGLLLPEAWKHGMSRGIALDSISNRVVYWLVYW